MSLPTEWVQANKLEKSDEVEIETGRRGRNRDRYQQYIHYSNWWKQAAKRSHNFISSIKTRKHQRLCNRCIPAWI
ncbi:hypothetical protein DYY66_2711 [Candidatus Nitrosotalea sp. FS]|nr:hypothetical protein [Candidatus Nitrosotalea sp. FS]